MAEVQRKAHRTQLVCVYVPPPLLAAFSATTWATGRGPATAACSTRPRWVLGCSGAVALGVCSVAIVVQWGCSGDAVVMQWGCSGVAVGGSGVQCAEGCCGQRRGAHHDHQAACALLLGLARQALSLAVLCCAPACLRQGLALAFFATKRRVCCPVQVHPGLFAAASPWLGGEDFKDLMLQVGGNFQAGALLYCMRVGQGTEPKRPHAHLLGGEDVKDRMLQVGGALGGRFTVLHAGWAAYAHLLGGEDFKDLMLQVGGPRRGRFTVQYMYCMWTA